METVKDASEYKKLAKQHNYIQGMQSELETLKQQLEKANKENVELLDEVRRLAKNSVLPENEKPKEERTQERDFETAWQQFKNVDIK